jgi:large subunit ribosomal protein L6
MATRQAFLRRGFQSSCCISSHVGSTPIPIPPSVKLVFPPMSISPTLPMTAVEAQRLLIINGPLGSHTVLLYPPIVLHPPSTDSPNLSVTVHDADEKRQKSVWGTTRTLIHNAIVGVSEGYNVDLRLVGVGYRATMEPIPQIFRDLQARMPRKRPTRNPGSPPYIAPALPSNRLNLKLGFSHPVLIDIPADIKVAIPAPTRLTLNGTDKQLLGLFAAKIRGWRKPEPYRGKVVGTLICQNITDIDHKGIFVGDETIKLKEVKKK